MKYLQVVATLICILLAVIALQLRGMRPITGADLERIGTGDGAYEKIHRMLPVVNVERVSTVSERIDVEVANTVDVDVQNQVSVKTGYVDSQHKYENEPLKVEISR
jgi:hypothetical protein